MHYNDSRHILLGEHVFQIYKDMFVEAKFLFWFEIHQENWKLFT